MGSNLEGNNRRESKEFSKWGTGNQKYFPTCFRLHVNSWEKLMQSIRQSDYMPERVQDYLRKEFVNHWPWLQKSVRNEYFQVTEKLNLS